MNQVSQIVFREDFILNLLAKLKTGNRRGIHLNVLPGNSASRLDLKKIDAIEADLANSFLNTLLTKDKFSFEISFDDIQISNLSQDEKNAIFLLSRKLNNMVHENDDQFLEFGIKNFSLGYPILIKREVSDPSKVIKAPLLIWNLEIEKSKNKANSWIISRNEESPIHLNELLRSYMATDANVNLEQISEQILEDGLVSQEELSSICKSVLAQLNVNLDNDGLIPKIEMCPGKDKIESLATDRAWIQWSGVFGIYKSRKEPIIRSNEELLKNLTSFQGEELILEKFQTSTVSSVETDPSKEQLVNSFTDSEIKIIQGPPGTGKSQALTAVITNSLENKGTVLVVCEKKTALDVIFRNLKEVGLDRYAVVIDDVNKDRNALIKKARLRAESIPTHSYHAREFDLKYIRFIELRDSFNKKHAEIFKKVIGKGWKDTIGEFLSLSKNEEYLYLKNNLNQERFNFNEAEFIELKDVVFDGFNLYSTFALKNISTLHEIKDSVFSTRYSRLSQDMFNGFIGRRESLLNELSLLIKDRDQEGLMVGNIFFTNQDELEKIKYFFNDIKLLVQETIKIISDYSNYSKNGEREILEVQVFDKIQALFSNKRKILNNKKEECLKKLSQHNELISQKEGELLSALSFDNKTNLVSICEELGRSENNAEYMISKIDQLLSLWAEISKKEQVLVNDNILTINLSSVNNFSNIDDYRNILNIELKRVDGLKKESHEYEPYHNWRKYLLTLNPTQALLIKALLELDSSDWNNVFTAWYLYGALIKHEVENGSLNSTDDELKSLTILYQELQRDQKMKIQNIWDSKLKISRELLEEKSSFNLLYNLRRNRATDRANSLRKIINSNFDLFTSVFPIVLTNPIAADSILPLKQGLFNVVIFDEASQLRIEDTFTSLVRGQYKVIAGDEHQMPPSNYFDSSHATIVDEDDELSDIVITESENDRELAGSESLLDYVKKIPGTTQSYLDYHYRSRHPALIDFSNVAIYGGNLIPFPAREIYKPIEFIHVGGTAKDNINELEVKEVLRIFSEDIHKKPDGTYPSVGIATFNLKQRNQISDALDALSIADSNFSEIFNGIKKAGHFVKNLENIQGDEMDIIIISTTYGVDDDGRFQERFGPVNQEKGYKLLNVLITRAKSKVYVCNSIPKERYMAYKPLVDSVGNNKKGLLYAYLAYADAVSVGDQEKIKQILSDLKSKSHEAARTIVVDEGLTESPFEQEVYEILCESFPKSSIEAQHKTGGFRIDFVITLKNAIKVAIECDGKTWHSSNEAYAYDMYRQKELEGMGYKVYRIWSTRWWHDHKREIRNLTKFTRELEN